MRHTYRGRPVPFLIPTPFFEGWCDSDQYYGQLYRYPAWKRVAYRAGWLAAKWTGQHDDGVTGRTRSGS